MPIVDYFVSPGSGSDTTGAGTLAAPWRSTQHALNTIKQNTNGGDRINLQAGAADVLAASLSLATYGTPNPGYPLAIEGYTSAQGDGGAGEISGAGLYAILTGAPTGVLLVNLHLHDCGSSPIIDLGNYVAVIGCELDGSSSASPIVTGSVATFKNNTVHGMSGAGAKIIASNMIFDNWIDARGSGCQIVVYSPYGEASRNTILCDGPSTGIQSGTFCFARNNSIYSANGSGKGIECAGYLDTCENNVVEGFTGVGGIGISTDVSSILEANRVYNCATAYNNSAGDVFDDGTNLTLTASPFNNPSAGDLSLNTDPNGGALCRAESYPSGFQGGPRTQWADCGAIQSKSAGGGTIIGSAIIRGVRR